MLTQRNNLASNFQSRYGGSVLRRWIQPKALQQIGAVDACMVHGDQHLLWAGRRWRVADDLSELRGLEMDVVSLHSANLSL
jgi:hypothetical protein